MTVDDDGPLQGHIGKLKRVNVLGEKPEGHLVILVGTVGEIAVVMQPEDMSDLRKQIE